MRKQLFGFVVFMVAVSATVGCGRTDLADRVGENPWVDDSGGGGEDGGELDAGADSGGADTGGPDTGPVPTCRDEVRNGDETDVDCGGDDCRACRDDARCGEGSDCLSGVCVDGRCTTPDDRLGLGEPCRVGVECESDLCGADVGSQPICTVTCGPGIRCGGGLTCFDAVGVCVTNDYCESADGVGEGPGCDGSVCEQCSDDASCDVGADGQRRCVCADGYEGDGFDCRDINECADPSSCPIGAACTNLEGGFDCQCAEGFQRVNGACQDIDECALGTDGCQDPARCDNTPGGFVCECPQGYDSNGLGCDDVEECADPALNACDENATCSNSPGGFSCACDMGYQGDGFSCTDINECAVPNACPPGDLCTNTPGGFACSCEPGYVLQAGVCVDVNECADGSAGCDANATCTNEDGGFDCDCDAGFQGDGFTCQPSVPGLTCEDPFDLGPVPASVSGDTSDATNDYERPRNSCPNGANQRRGAGSRDEAYSFTPAQTGTYRVRATTGTFAASVYLIGDCDDVSNSCFGSDTFDIEFSAQLDANTTYYLVVDGFTNNADQSGPYTLDVDLDECATTPGICGATATCEDTFTGYDCVCAPGYELVNGACVDVDECATGTNNCSANATCANTDGGFDCTCNPPFAGDGVTCSDPNSPGETCAVPFDVMTLPFITNGDNSNSTNEYSVGDRACPGMITGAGAAGADQVYAVTPTVTGNYRIDVNANLSGNSWQPAVYVVSACGDIDGTCVAGNRAFLSNTAGVNASLTAGQLYYVIVDGAFNSRPEAGPYTLSIIQLP